MRALLAALLATLAVLAGCTQAPPEPEAPIDAPAPAPPAGPSLPAGETVHYAPAFVDASSPAPAAPAGERDASDAAPNVHEAHLDVELRTASAVVVATHGPSSCVRLAGPSRVLGGTLLATWTEGPARLAMDLRHGNETANATGGSGVVLTLPALELGNATGYADAARVWLAAPPDGAAAPPSETTIRLTLSVLHTGEAPTLAAGGTCGGARLDLPPAPTPPP